MRSGLSARTRDQSGCVSHNSTCTSLALRAPLQRHARVVLRACTSLRRSRPSTRTHACTHAKAVHASSIVVWMSRPCDGHQKHGLELFYKVSSDLDLLLFSTRRCREWGCGDVGMWACGHSFVGVSVAPSRVVHVGACEWLIRWLDRRTGISSVAYMVISSGIWPSTCSTCLCRACQRCLSVSSLCGLSLLSSSASHAHSISLTVDSANVDNAWS